MPSSLRREAAAEFLGTFVLIVFGCGSVAQAVLSDGGAGTPFSIHFAWGLAVTMAIYCAGGISGAHINPAVTLALAVRRGFPWGKVPAYVAAQTAGAFLAAAVVHLAYAEAFEAFDGGVRQVVGEKATAGIFATYPAEHLSTFPGGFVDQVVGTALLVLVVFGVSDPRNMPGGAHLAPWIIGMLVALIGMSFAFNSGYAINPARDLGPRTYTALAGWGPEVFTVRGWAAVPIVAPLLGGVLGACIYDFMIARPPDQGEDGQAELPTAGHVGADGPLDADGRVVEIPRPGDGGPVSAAAGAEADHAGRAPARRS